MGIVITVARFGPLPDNLINSINHPNLIIPAPLNFSEILVITEILMLLVKSEIIDKLELYFVFVVKCEI